jgi:hypothetical protein
LPSLSTHSFSCGLRVDSADDERFPFC